MTTHVLLLGSHHELLGLAEAVPGHRVTSLDRHQMDECAHLGGLAGVLTAGTGSTPDVVLLGDAIPLAEALSIAELVDASFPLVAVALVAEPDTDIALRAMRVGIRDIVPPSISVDDLKVLLHRISARKEEQVPEVPRARVTNRVVVVTSPRGGVGRSTVAAKLAVELARSTTDGTVLVDLDLQFGDVSSLLGLAPVLTIGDAWDANGHTDTLILKTLLCKHESGLQVLCSTDAPTMADRASSDQIAGLVRQLSSQFGNVVVDTAAGLDQATLGAIGLATDLVVVSRTDMVCARALREQMAMIDRLQTGRAARHLVVNAVTRRSAADVRRVEAATGVPAAVLVPRSTKLRRAGNLGRISSPSAFSTPVGRSFVKLANLLAGTDDRGGVNKHRGVAMT